MAPFQEGLADLAALRDRETPHELFERSAPLAPSQPAGEPLGLHAPGTKHGARRCPRHVKADGVERLVPGERRVALQIREQLVGPVRRDGQGRVCAREPRPRQERLGGETRPFRKAQSAELRVPDGAGRGEEEPPTAVSLLQKRRQPEGVRDCEEPGGRKRPAQTDEGARGELGRDGVHRQDTLRRERLPHPPEGLDAEQRRSRAVAGEGEVGDQDVESPGAIQDLAGIPDVDPDAGVPERPAVEIRQGLSAQPEHLRIPVDEVDLRHGRESQDLAQGQAVPAAQDQDA